MVLCGGFGILVGFGFVGVGRQVNKCFTFMGASSGQGILADLCKALNTTMNDCLSIFSCAVLSPMFLLESSFFGADLPAASANFLKKYFVHVC